MYTVVVGVDEEDEHALGCARAVANLPGDASEKRAILFHCFVDNPSGASATQIHAIRQARDYFEERGVEFDIAESSGDPTEEIIGTAERVGADLIVVGGRKRSPTGKALVGSVTQSVILDADRPVMVTGVDRDDDASGGSAAEE